MTPFEQAVRTVQFLSVDMVEQAKSGHPGAPLGLAGIGVEIFTRHLRFVPSDPSWPNRDRFVLSCGHASALLYSLLFLADYGLKLEDLKQFRQVGSLTPGHPEYGHTAGVETTTGPLGQGLGNAVGLALASKMAGARVNRPGSSVVDYRVFCVASDGDMMEGLSSEVAALAGHLGLDNLVVVYDDNHISIDGSTDLALTEDVGARFAAAGWYVQHTDGLDPIAFRATLDAAVAETQRPSLVVARTIIGYGAPTKAGKSSAHGAPLGAAETLGAKRALGWSEDAFHVGPEARLPFAEQIEKNQSRYQAWKSLVAGLQGEQQDGWTQLIKRERPANLLEELTLAAGQKDDATRNHSGVVLQRAAALLPFFVSGSADLTESTKAGLDKYKSVTRQDYSGRFLHYGVREHAMGAMMNGLALSGMFLPAGSTFLMFSDYMRPSIRLAAMMGLSVAYIYTHDSIFVGEDGPTHQPIEQLWSLRLIPNLHVFRPADALETAVAWAHALTRSDGPTALSLTRHKVPHLQRPAGFTPQDVLQGGYIVSDVADPELVLLATGSEVGVAVGAKRLLEAEGRRIRVVSVPCLELFSAQSPELKERVLGKGIRRASLEAGLTLGWRALIRDDGIAIGIDKFGQSGPAEALAEIYGITAETVAKKLRAALK